MNRFPGVQHNGQRHQDRGGRGAGRDGPLLHRGDALHHLVHLRASSQILGMSIQVRLRQGHHEHDRPGRHHPLLHHPGDDSGREGGGHRSQGPGGAEQGGEQSGHVSSHPSSDSISASVSNLQVVATFERSSNFRTDTQSVHEGARAFNVFPLHR